MDTCVLMKKLLTLSARAEWARASLGLTAREVDRRAGLSQGHFAAMRRRDRDVSVQVCDRFAAALCVPFEWLAVGRGPVPSPDDMRALSRCST